jgi:hypothetical protein
VRVITLAVILIGIGLPPPPARNPTPNVSGGTPAQRAKVQAAYDQIPSCWRSCDGSKVQIAIGGDSAYYTTSPDHVQVSPDYLDGNLTAEKRNAYNRCSALAPSEHFDDTMGETLTHELAHRMDFKCQHGVVEQFLALRYRGMERAIESDPAYLVAMVALQDAGDDHDKQCAAFAKIDAALKAHHVPMRFNGDTHALDGNGSEYFAVAIETLTRMPDVFCRNYSEAEQDFLVAHFGKCLHQFPSTPACLWNDPPDDAKPSRFLDR